MALGLPLMRVLTVSQLRALLAHEFGHYYGGDTRLAPWVHRTRQAMYRAMVNLGKDSGAMTVLRINAVAHLARNLVMAILGWYWRIFLRATLAVSRRLEFRADELACWLAGSRSLMDGLCSIAKAAAAGQAFWQTELAPALQAGYRPPVAEGFGQFMAARGVAQATAALLDSQLKSTKRNPYDTHPPLKARLDAAHFLGYPSVSQDDACAISLIDHLDSLEHELLESRIPQLKKAALKPMPWEKIGMEVYVPGWRKIVAEHKALVAEVTVESLPDAVRDLKKMGARMRDPKGMLLTHEQRAGRASTVLSMALAVALIDRGWELYAQPGESYLQRDGVSISPALLIAELASGKLTAEDWHAQCRKLDIGELRLDG